MPSGRVAVYLAAEVLFGRRNERGAMAPFQVLGALQRVRARQLSNSGRDKLMEMGRCCRPLLFLRLGLVLLGALWQETART